jgi:FKBP-type peptidyl-prolyl cis-trans isomerase SlyD
MNGGEMNPGEMAPEKMDSGSAITILKDRVVSLRYIMFNGRGEVLENSMEGAPISYLHGSDGIQLILQAQLEGLVTGSRKSVVLAKDAGLTDDDFSFEVIIDEVREALPEELLLGYPTLSPAPACGEDCRCYTH